MSYWNSAAHLPAGDFDSLLTQRRRFRSAKACFPCRRRKVKCNLGEPCDTCIARKHPELCIYRTGSAGGSSAQAPEQQETEVKPNISGAVPKIGHPRGLFVDPAAPYTSKVHLGPESLPTVISASAHVRNPQAQSDSHQDAQTVFRLLCLQDTSVTFPFTNLWNPDDGPEAVYRALPCDEAILNYLEICKRSLFRIMPSIIAEDEFELVLNHLLAKRAASPADAFDNLPPSYTSSWFAVLFSILACGVQLEPSEEQVNIRHARVLACCSFQCLRFGNFLSYPDTETIQALLLLVNFLRNQGDASASWSLLGLAIRLAQSLGLHYAPNPYADGDEPSQQSIVNYSLWRSLVWQDTHVSLCYGRPCGITVNQEMPVLQPNDPRLSGAGLSFPEACNDLFVVANKIGHALDVAHFSGKRLTIERIREFKNVLDQIEFHAVPHLQELSKCQHEDDYVNYHIFNVFSDAVNLCLCRPAVICFKFDENKELTSLYLSRCRSVLRNYLALMELNCPMHRTWLFIHVALSCALTLGIVGDAFKLVADKSLLAQFLHQISQATVCVDIPAYENSLVLLKDYLDKIQVSAEAESPTKQLLCQNE